MHNKKIRVLHVISSLHRGGAENILSCLALEQHKMEIDVLVVALKPGGEHVKVLVEAGVRVIEFNFNINPFSIYREYRKFKKLVGEWRPDILQSWMYYSDLLTAIAVKNLNKMRPALLWGIRCSNMKLSDYGLMLRIAIKLCIRYSYVPDRIAANSNSGKLFHQSIGYKKEIDVVYNGIDVSKYRFNCESRSRIRNQLGIEDSQVLFGMFARFDPMKDFDNLISAVSLLKNVIVLLVGRYTEKQEYPDNFICLGEKNNVIDYMSAVDVVLSSSKYGEGFSNSIAEAMSCGRPVIATDVGDSRYILEKTGIVVEPSNPKALANAIMSFRNRTQSDIIDLGQLARDRIVNFFSVSNMIIKFNNIYVSMLQHKNRENNNSL